MRIISCALNYFAGAVKTYKFTRVHFLFELVAVVCLCTICRSYTLTQQCCSLPENLLSNSLSMKVSLMLICSANMYV